MAIYWVKQGEGSNWEIAEWYGGLWYFMYPDCQKASDSDLFAIHAERIKPPDYQS